MIRTPVFSVIIPTKDRPDMLSSCLSSLGKLDYSMENYEVIVVDDGSENLLAGVYDQFAGEIPVRFLQQPVSRGPAAARNTGAENAQGRYLVFLDDDCFPDPQWLRSYETGFSKLNKDGLVGSTRNPNPAVIGAQVWCLVLAFQYDYWQDQSGNLKIAITNNFAVERQAFADIGGFDTTFNAAASEDRDFSWRFNEAGYQIAQCPGAVVWHSQPALSFIKYIKLQFRYGYYANIFHKKRNSTTAADFAQRFGSPSRLRYAVRLFSFALKKKAKFTEIIVLYLGHISHYLGRIYQALPIRRKN